MSSSKVFKDDPSFTPITLIQEEIEPADSPDQHSEEAEQDTTGTADQTDVTAGEEHADGDGDETTAAAAPEPAPQATVDVQAIRREGYEQGVQDTLQQQGKEIQQASAALVTACRRLDRLHRNMLEQSRGDMINLVIALSRKILFRELETGRDTIAATLQAALDQAIASDEFVITLHPDDLEVARAMEPALIESVRSLEHIVFKTSAEMMRGGCLVESNTCAVDATIEAQLEAAREFLEQEVSTMEQAADRDQGNDDTSPPPVEDRNGA